MEWTTLKPSKAVDVEVPWPPLRIRHGWRPRPPYPHMEWEQRGKEAEHKTFARFEMVPTIATNPSTAPEVAEIGVERPWLPDERAEFERYALGILHAHCFPMVVDFEDVILWTWTGGDLRWAECLPPHNARTRSHAPDGSTIVSFEDARASEDYRLLWPAWQPFDWAETVHRFRRARERAERAGDAQRIWEAGFGVGVYLGQYERERRHRRPRVYSSKKRVSPAALALAKAQEFCAADPEMTQRQMIEKLEAAYKAKEIGYLPDDRNEMVRNWVKGKKIGPLKPGRRTAS